MKLVVAGCFCSLIALSAQAQGQEVPQTNNDSEKPAPAQGDIVVTANRVSSYASKTPIALTAISGDELTSSAITNPTQLGDAVPNLAIDRVNGLQITIRGVTSTDTTEKGDPSAAFLVNGIYLARPQTQEVSFYDVQRVEVLRGPQGTLYGRNTTAGLVNVITHDPDSKFGGSVDASYESFDHVNGTAVLNLPVSDAFALRAAGNYDRQGSNVINKSGDGFNYGAFKDNVSGRLTALIKPTGDLTIKLIGDYSSLKGTRLVGNNTGYTTEVSNFFTNNSPLSSLAATTAVQPIYIDLGSTQQRTTRLRQFWQPRSEMQDRGISGELDWKVGDFTLTYLGSFRSSSFHDKGTFAGISRLTFDGHYKQTSQEVRLAYANGPLQVQAGGYYFKERSGIGAFFLDPSALGLPVTAIRFGFPQDPTIAMNKSLFGQVRYEILPHVNLTAGVRYSHDDKSRVGHTILEFPAPVGVVNLQLNDAAATFSKTTWRAGVDYDSSIGLFYASIATGYKAGGFNDGCLSGPTAPSSCVYTKSELFYDPETLTAYEAGFKVHTADNQLRVNGSYFHYDYKGLQLSTFGNFGGCGFCQITKNAGAAKIDGLELEALFHPSSELQFNLGVNWLDARYTDYHPGISVGGTPVILNFAGHALNRSPKWTGNAGVTYTKELGDGSKVVAEAGIRYTSRYMMTDLANLIDYYQPGYTNSSVSVTYNFPNDTFYVGVYAKNLEDKIALTGIANGLASWLDARRFGIRAGVKF